MNLVQVLKVQEEDEDQLYLRDMEQTNTIFISTSN